MRFVADERSNAGRIQCDDWVLMGGVDSRIWEARIGGYPVLPRWFKQRRGRRLSSEEWVHIRRAARALNAAATRISSFG